LFAIVHFPSDSKIAPFHRGRGKLDRNQWSARQQFEECGRALSRRALIGHHRHLWFGKIHFDARRSAPGGAGAVGQEEEAEWERRFVSTSQAPPKSRRLRGRSVAHRQNASRSTPATYIKVFDETEIRMRNSLFSGARLFCQSLFFNAEGGVANMQRTGRDQTRDELSAEQLCALRTALAHNPQTLEVLYNEKSIGDVMEMTVDQAAEFFSAHPKIGRPLSLLVDTGLGYLKLGQPSPTLSGGEAQRLKLVTELKRGIGRAQHEKIRKMRKPGSTLYLLEEPTIGLHMADIELLLNVIHALVDEGNTVIVIEHNLSVIAEADYIVDIGPEAERKVARCRRRNRRRLPLIGSSHPPFCARCRRWKANPLSAAL
jgi:ABC-type histidine transport system ATPase subunit